MENETNTSGTSTEQENTASDSGQGKTETLVVVSKVKQYIRDKAGFNSSSCFVEALTRKVAEECIKGIEHARSAGRKTVMGKDITA